MFKKFKLVGGYAGSILSKNLEIADSSSSIISELHKYLPQPKLITPDIVTITARYVQSGANKNRAYFDQQELVKAYDTISYKALDREHNLEDIVGHIYASTFVDRKTNRVLEQDFLLSLDEKQLKSLDIDVIIGAAVYIDRFPMLESPLSRKAPAVSMETFFESFQLLLSNGVKISLEEAEVLGWNALLEQIMGEHSNFEELKAAHTVKVILADRSETPMQVFKWLEGLTFSGGGLVENPACPKCLILHTNLEMSQEMQDCMDECDEGDSDCMDKCKEMMAKKQESNCGCSDKAGKAKADKLLTINLTKLDSYMETWRNSSEGKPINHQVKDQLISVTETEDEDKEKSEVTEVFVKDRDPNASDKKPSICPQYKYEIWLMQGQNEEQRRHWCIYANDKCPTAGDRTFHECQRWFKREDEWLMDMRNFRDANNPFAPEGYEDESENSIMMSSSVEFKKMDAMVDSFLHQVEVMAREREIASKKRRP